MKRDTNAHRKDKRIFQAWLNDLEGNHEYVLISLAKKRLGIKTDKGLILHFVGKDLVDNPIDKRT